MKCQFTLIEKLHLFIKMEYKITEKQKEKIIASIQSYIDSEMRDLKEYADNGDLSYEETMQVDSVEKIKVVDVEKKAGWVINVRVYTKGRFTFDDVFYHISHEIRKYIGMNSINEIDIIDTREFGPGIDF